MERRFEIRPFGVRYMCDNCKQGEMIAIVGPQAFVQEADKLLVRHICNLCRNIATYKERYPTVRYEDVYEPPVTAQVTVGPQTNAPSAGLGTGQTGAVPGLKPT